MQRQQQQFSDFDLLAVFSDEAKAAAAETKLHKEGFSEEEVFRLASDAIASGQFREHGPNRERSSVFLQTTRSAPNPVTIVLLAVVCGLGALAVARPPADGQGFRQISLITISALAATKSAGAQG